MADTIYALASGGGRSGVAVVRISGRQALNVLSIMGVENPEPRYALLRNLKNPKDNSVLDNALVLYFNAPHSFTGEDVVEIHLHGSKAVLSETFSVLEDIQGVALAQPGEFSKRAFENGKMDLTGAEGLIDLINSETHAQMKQAQRQAVGELGTLYNGWADKIIPLLAHYEAYIDFPDEDLPESLSQEALSKIGGIMHVIEHHLADNNRGERLRDGIQVAVVGSPNAGKSSLVNTLAKRDVAIVSDTAGTTRDVIEVSLDMAGYPVRLFDTAGIRDSSDEIEVEGIKRAITTAQSADIILLIIDASNTLITQDSIDKSIAELGNNTAPVIVLANKCEKQSYRVPIADNVFAVSMTNAFGLDVFLSHLQSVVLDCFGMTGDPVITRARHREALVDCNHALQRALIAPEAELIAEDLRVAVRCIGRITGQIDVEELLDIVFNDFCIGK